MTLLTSEPYAIGGHTTVYPWWTALEQTNHDIQRQYWPRKIKTCPRE